MPPAQTFPNGCHIVEVEIDPETGVVTLARYTIVDDFGRIINPLLLEGQVHGGIVQGIGQALLEHAVYDPDSGQLLAGSFMDYAMPRADDIPLFAFSTYNVPSNVQPFRRQRSRRSRRCRRAAGGDQCDRGRSVSSGRRAPYRHAGDTGSYLADAQRQERKRAVNRSVARSGVARYRHGFASLISNEESLPATTKSL